MSTDPRSLDIDREALRQDLAYAASGPATKRRLAAAVPALLSALEAAEETIAEMWYLHHPEMILHRNLISLMCASCRCAWPCPTGEALERAE